VSGATVIGLVDRDFYSDSVLLNAPAGVTVLPAHEIESLLCERRVVELVASHMGKNPTTVWNAFRSSVQNTFVGTTFTAVVARRVRTRINDLLDGAFSGAQVLPTVEETRDRHRADLESLALASRVETMFSEEHSRVADALKLDSSSMLAILPGKHLLSLLANELGLDGTSDLVAVIIAALNRREPIVSTGLRQLGNEIEIVLSDYLPPRRFPATA
jgi:hypothetical protein